MFLKQKIRIKLKSFNNKLLEQSILEITNITKKTGAFIKGPIFLPTKIQRFDILRSPHVNKNSYDQFEIRTYNRIIDVINSTQITLNVLMKIDLPSGVDIEIKFK
ncbi:30S ribosomal protein S10 [Candidatus Zinderia endosymbiont of Aphrophora alni]|uniref:30S ribosomal protein S10 n=1 Tax=Candidatus Zinderia endosymbiont of Aphrophora alni TaxID=3077951 RepID=UPI0030D23191